MQKQIFPSETHACPCRAPQDGSKAHKHLQTPEASGGLSTAASGKEIKGSANIENGGTDIVRLLITV